MLSMVTPDEAMEHLRLEGADRPWLEMAIPMIEDAVIRWCGSKDRVAQDGVGPLESVRMAILVELARLHVQREGPQQKNHIDWFRQGYSLGPGATALLQPLRKPTVA